MYDQIQCLYLQLLVSISNNYSKWFFQERCIDANRQRIIEGELRCKELNGYLERVKTGKIVWIAEDGTAITPKINYDSTTDELVG